MRVKFNMIRDYDVETPVTVEIVKTDNPEVPRCLVALFPDGEEIALALSARSVHFLANEFCNAATEIPDNPFDR